VIAWSHEAIKPAQLFASEIAVRAGHGLDGLDDHRRRVTLEASKVILVAGVQPHHRRAVSPSGLAVDADNVYWVGGGALLSCAKGGCGCRPTQIASASGAAAGVAVLAQNIFWTMYDLGQVAVCTSVGCPGRDGKRLQVHDRGVQQQPERRGPDEQQPGDRVGRVAPLRGRAWVERERRSHRSDHTVISAPDAVLSHRRSGGPRRRAADTSDRGGEGPADEKAYRWCKPPRTGDAIRSRDVAARPGPSQRAPAGDRVRRHAMPQPAQRAGAVLQRRASTSPHEHCLALHRETGANSLASLQLQDVESRSSVTFARQTSSTSAALRSTTRAP
jgi:hypothetical protein